MFEHPPMPIDPLLAPHALTITPRLLEVSHVAHRLSVSQEFVRRLIREKKLAAIRLGTRWRVDPLDLQAFIDLQRVHPLPRRDLVPLSALRQATGA